MRSINELRLIKSTFSTHYVFIMPLLDQTNKNKVSTRRTKRKVDEVEKASPGNSRKRQTPKQSKRSTTSRKSTPSRQVTQSLQSTPNRQDTVYRQVTHYRRATPSRQGSTPSKNQKGATQASTSKLLDQRPPLSEKNRVRSLLQNCLLYTSPSPRDA